VPAVFLGILMGSGYIQWRPKYTSGLTDVGPEDQRLIIEFTGKLSGQPWVTLTSYGYAIDLDNLCTSVPVLFDKNWLRNRGLQKASITEISDNKYVIDMQL